MGIENNQFSIKKMKLNTHALIVFVCLVLLNFGVAKPNSKRFRRMVSFSKLRIMREAGVSQFCLERNCSGQEFGSGVTGGKISKILQWQITKNRKHRDLTPSE